MIRPIDHLVIAVRDLEQARTAYRRLGFTLTPVAEHPFGTANSLVQLHGSFLELLGIADDEMIPMPAEGNYSFAALNRDFLMLREGLSMLVLRSTDAAADRADFAARGLPVYEPFHFERTARAPDGSERKVAFSLAFTADARIRDAGFFTCQHHHPGNFWRPEYQAHPNGAVAIDAAVMVARDPADFHEFLTHFTGQHDIRSDSLGITFELGEGRVQVLSPVAAKAFYGVDAGSDPKPRFIAARIRVADLVATRAHLAGTGVSFAERSGGLVVPPEEAGGVALAFA